MSEEQDPAPCAHEEFETVNHIRRVCEVEGGVPVAFWLEVTIICSQCREPFIFLGLPGGVDAARPTCSGLGQEARLPIAPASRVFFQQAGQLVGAPPVKPGMRRGN